MLRIAKEQSAAQTIVAALGFLSIKANSPKLHPLSKVQMNLFIVLYFFSAGIYSCYCNYCFENSLIGLKKI